MRIDLRARSMLLVCVTVAVICFSHPGWLLGVVGCELVSMAVLGVQLTGAGKMLRPMLVIMAVVWCVTVFVPPLRFLNDPVLGQVLFTLGPATATWAGVAAGGMFVLRMVAMLLATWIVLADAEVDEVIELANHWRLPPSVTTVITCSVATVPRLLARREQIAEAQTARGIQGRGTVSAWRSAVALMVPLIVTCMATAQDMAIALSMRGHGASRRMTVMSRLVWTPRDRGIFAVALLVTIMVPVVRFGLGWGSVLTTT
ncbi:hypothetical protein HMPREF1531_02527 [Propionibacterium sp. oral taxon 192 str. F0372]|uniref:energy-coupling factor transporter transmembrane component T family protein n=1 Tax=Propionibacterium sp. oral taxon 192 TaxID=671222 RepID=UPI0003535EDF|nr:energy-coupling factor transporter transmembrane component T [Propionibacterium sp. oral taxon 192]EPH00415.1 hypothetical protein HMPREF1531_02527 [Propionibacterium sp. oral taxon 192 str. F0372]